MPPIQQMKEIIAENQQFISGIQLTNRDSVMAADGSYVICGPRRAGKSYRLYQFAQENLSTPAGFERLLYINFEDERFLGASSSDLDDLLKAYSELFSHEPLIMLDEIHVVEGWEKFARRLRDRHLQVLVTGSNATMLSRDIASTLGGRFIIQEQYPFAFGEYLHLRNIDVPQNAMTTSQRGQIVRAFADYFRGGGFPEVLNYERSEEFLGNLYQYVVYSDLILRNKIRNEFALRLLVKKIGETVGTECSYRRIQRLIKATGADLSINSTIDYIGYLEDAYLVLSIQNFAKKFTERESTKKYYFIDNGVLHLFQRSNDAPLLENIVFLDLIRRYPKGVTYLRDKYELDFYLPDQKHLVQVAVDLSNAETRDRELRALSYFANEYGARTLTIVTRDEEDVIAYNTHSISVFPVWKWLLREGR